MQVSMRRSGPQFSTARPSAAGATRPMCVARPSASRRQGPVETSAPQTTAKTIGLELAIVPLMAMLTDVLPAMAKDGEYGILEGRTAALVHPAMEFIILGSSLYAAYLGWQWRRTREMGDEIRALRTATPVSADGTAAPNPVLEQKEAERKALLAGGYKDKHFLWGSFLLASGVGIAIEGCANTFMRTGKLFPGPHLFFGAFICALWCLAAAMVPAMQKGDNNARNAHIALNAVQIFLLLSQIPTGLEILLKVFEFTVWP